MNWKRIYHTLRLYTITSPMKRAEYLKKKNIFGGIGNRVMIMSRKIPLYPELIKIHNNVWVASDVKFITHDVTHFMLNGIDPERPFTEKVGGIEVSDNVFIGAESLILYNVKIGSNVIIAAGSVVTKDIPDNSIAAGIPAKVIGRFDDYVEQRKKEKQYKVNNSKGYIDPETIQEIWTDFNTSRK